MEIRKSQIDQNYNGGCIEVIWLSFYHHAFLIIEEKCWLWSKRVERTPNACSKSTTERLEKGVKYVQSWQ